MTRLAIEIHMAPGRRQPSALPFARSYRSAARIDQQLGA
jgi:hypothetical protein